MLGRRQQGAGPRNPGPLALQDALESTDRSKERHAAGDGWPSGSPSRRREPATSSVTPDPESRLSAASRKPRRVRVRETCDAGPLRFATMCRCGHIPCHPGARLPLPALTWRPWLGRRPRNAPLTAHCGKRATPCDPMLAESTLQRTRTAETIASANDATAGAAHDTSGTSRGSVDAQTALPYTPQSVSRPRDAFVCAPEPMLNGAPSAEASSASDLGSPWAPRGDH
jgi:hypothetical protein